MIAGHFNEHTNEICTVQFSLGMEKGKLREANHVTYLNRPSVHHEERNELFLTIERADIDSHAKDKVEVMLQVFFDDGKSPNVC